MAAIVEPDDEEKYLVALFDDPSGIDLAEFCFVDETSEDGCFRLWDFQHSWYRDEATFQVDQCGRALGKTNGIVMRAFAFPFHSPGREMLITAPELNHLRPLTDAIESRLLSTRLGSEMLPRTKGRGLARQPHWQARFANNAHILSRLPNKDGRGVKGIHADVVELDEGQDYSPAGWVEIIETFNRGNKGARWRVHGVSRGVRDKYYEITQEGSGWRVHRFIASHRPTWSPEERAEKTKTYGGSRQNPDYRRNIYGDHGDAASHVFVLARLMACVDQDEGSVYNTEVYYSRSIEHEHLLDPYSPDGRRPIASLIEFPGTHLVGYSQHVTPELADGRRSGPREVGAPKGYSAYYAGMDVGMTNHPSEILVFGQRTGTDTLELLARIHLRRIDTDSQVEVVDTVFAFYGSKLKAFGIDRTGLGFSLWETLKKRPYGERVHGYNFSEKVPVAVEDRELKTGEKPEDLVVWRNVIEHATDVLRVQYVDPGRARLPFDRELLTEWQGQAYTIVKTTDNPYGKREYAAGRFHTLDAAKTMAAAKTLPPVLALIEGQQAKPAEPIYDVFVGGMVI